MGKPRSVAASQRMACLKVKMIHVGFCRLRVKANRVLQLESKG